MTDFMAYFTERTDAMVTLTENLVRYESPTGNKQLVDALSMYIKTLLDELEAEVEVFQRHAVGDIWLAKWNSDRPNKPIMLLLHMDTVWPEGTLDNEVSLKREETQLFGPGTVDMKASITIALEAIRGLKDLNAMPDRPIWMLLTTDEETGSHHSRDLIIELARQCELVLCMEPAADGDALKTSRKGMSNYTITALGKASHAGLAPEEGVNAVVELAHHTLTVHKLNNLRKGTSVSVTVVHGGTVDNVIPAQATAQVDVRYFYKEEAERVDAALRALSPVLPGSRVEVEGEFNRPPMERDENIAAAFNRVQQLAKDLGMSLNEASVGGVSDANLTADAGIPTLDGLGAQGGGAHALHEHILIRSLPRRTALLASILKNW
jgi:glutamate carboxypeptidase